MKPGDIVFLGQSHGQLTRQRAEQLIHLRPAAVVLADDLSTAPVPHYGPHLLLESHIPVISGLGVEALDQVRDGKKVRLEGGSVYLGSTLIGSGRLLDEHAADDLFTAGQQKLSSQVTAYFGNAAEFLETESPLFIDGIGIPDTGVGMRNRPVVILSPAADLTDQVAGLRDYLRETDPVVIGVESAADVALANRLRPDLIVGNPENISTDALRSGAKVVLPAQPDGTAMGLERIQDLGVGAVTFPARSQLATDLAVLLADYHGASVIVYAGEPLDLEAVLADTSASRMLTRLRVGDSLVTARSLASVRQRGEGSGLAWLWALIGLVVLIGVIVAIAGLAGPASFADNLINTWNNVVATVQGWVN